ncbi:MAG: flippase-like domain-containing protein [Caulobacteraceae bacterium]|nr:flippase-like domain-containing protein [Caulobacteraceae bacterium]
MKPRTLLAAAVGVGLLVWLVASAGLKAVTGAVATLGAGGFVAITAFQLALGVLAGCAWALLGAGRPDGAPGRFVRARLVREAAGQALPFTQLGGIALGGRALALEGVAGPFAFASTLMDVAIEFTTQVAYAALGAGLLTALKPANTFGRGVLVLLLGLAAMAAGLLYAQSHGAHVVERLVRRFTGRQGRGEGDEEAGGGLPVAAALAALRRRPAFVGGAWIIHLVAWTLTGVQTWLTFRLLHLPATLAGALVIDSLVSAAKAAAFAVPSGLGVQEGAFILLGQLFGVPPAAALALSLIRRGRDLVLAFPILGWWQLRHGGRIWGRERLGVE